MAGSCRLSTCSACMGNKRIGIFFSRGIFVEYEMACTELHSTASKKHGLSLLHSLQDAMDLAYCRLSVGYLKHADTGNIFSNRSLNAMQQVKSSMNSFVIRIQRSCNL